MSYTVAREGEILGVFSHEEIARGLQEGRFYGDDLVWREGMTQWEKMGVVIGRNPRVGGRLDWESSKTSKAFIATIRNILTDPAGTFKSAGHEHWARAYLFFILCFGLGTFFSIAYQMGAAWLLSNAVGGGTGGQAENLGFQGGGAVILNGLFAIPFAICMGALIPPVGAAVIHLCLLTIGGGAGGWGATFKAYCYANGAAMSLLSIPVCGSVVGWVWGIICSVVAIREVHDISTGRAVVAIFLPLILCCGIVGSIGVVAGAMGGVAR